MSVVHKNECILGLILKIKIKSITKLAFYMYYTSINIEGRVYVDECLFWLVYTSFVLSLSVDGRYELVYNKLSIEFNLLFSMFRFVSLCFADDNTESSLTLSIFLFS